MGVEGRVPPSHESWVASFLKDQMDELELSSTQMQVHQYQGSSASLVHDEQVMTEMATFACCC